MKKNILEVCFSPSFGGLELHMKDLTKALGLKAVINKKSKLKEMFIEENIPFFEMKRYSFFKLAKVIDEHNIDVVHINWTKDIPVVILAKLFSKKKPKVVQTRNMHMTRFKDDFYHKFLYKNISTIVGISAKVSEQLHKFIPADIRPNIVTWYSGVDKPYIIDEKTKIELKNKHSLGDEFLVCNVARVEFAKGTHIVLEAVQKLRENGINAKAIIVGPANNKEYYDNLVNKYTKDIFTGFSKIANSYIQISNCFVLATDNETFGMAIMDAMRCGTCVLGSDSGGPLESITHMQTGLHFKTMDSDDLYKKLKLIYEDENLRSKLALAAQEKADKEYDLSTQFEEMREILQSV
ncbi:glycosyltransferase family 4 protein [Aliarcobacter trophiarum]|uniref:glycosyltransferase family 4 protein n=1 Tax=Aliarcobacter trophiarum TaxID=708186 RepID=UPI00100A3D75|nr:glycosyltransferase family 4 protein [Aliarcobacter trophiarum]RXI28669.1 glycosyl transferase [Aliarcobacter trophiarum]